MSHGGKRRSRIIIMPVHAVRRVRHMAQKPLIAATFEDLMQSRVIDALLRPVSSSTPEIKHAPPSLL